MRNVALALLLFTSLFTTPLLRASRADTIYLKSGQRLEVESWRDVGDEIEFARFGGIMRIPKSDIERVEGKSTSSTMEMYSTLDARELLIMLESAAQAWRGGSPELQAIATRWRQARVAPGLRDIHARGARALQAIASLDDRERFAAMEELQQIHRMLKQGVGERP